MLHILNIVSSTLLRCLCDHILGSLGKKECLCKGIGSILRRKDFWKNLRALRVLIVLLFTHFQVCGYRAKAMGLLRKYYIVWMRASFSSPKWDKDSE